MGSSADASWFTRPRSCNRSSSRCATSLSATLADKPSTFVTRPLALLELAGVLRQTNPKEAGNVYQQIKNEFPETNISEQADRGLDTLAPKS